MVRKKKIRGNGTSKSKFQQRLEEMQKKHREETGDPGDHKSQSAQRDNDRGWFCTRLHPPPYYAPVDLWVGEEILESWHRVSDGDNDYYCNSKDSSFITEPSHWRKRPDVNYPYYEPMTEDDIKQVTYRDLKEVIDLLNKEMIPSLEVDYHEGFNDGLIKAIKALNVFIQKKRNGT